MGNIRLFLRANDRLFVNGAVLRTDRKVSLELMNNAVFLLENHVLQKEDATTPLKQMYFAVQLLLMDPKNTDRSIKRFREILSEVLGTFKNRELVQGIKDVDVALSTGNAFAALKLIRRLFPLEEAILSEPLETEVEKTLAMKEFM